MATIRKRGKTWRVEVAVRGQRASATFGSKAEAREWGIDKERELRRGPGTPDIPLADVLDRYAREVSPGKRGARWEKLRIGRLREMALGKARLPALSATDIAAWRDARLKEVGPATVRREWSLLTHALTLAVLEWGYLESNPMKGVRRPQEPAGRERRLSDSEVAALCAALGYGGEGPPATVSQRVAVAFLLAIETAMRAGELAGLTWDRVNLSSRVARLDATKNGQARDVPLSPRALALLEALPGREGSVLGVRAAQIDALFRKARGKAGLSDVHFHDSRHEAVCRLSRKLDVLDLARVTGHRDLRMLLRYYHASAADLAGRL